LRVTTTVGFAIVALRLSRAKKPRPPLAWPLLTVKANPSYNEAVARLFPIVLFFAALLVVGAPSSAQESLSGGPQTSGLPLPRFVSLRADEVNMRTGPGVR